MRATFHRHRPFRSRQESKRLSDPSPSTLDSINAWEARAFGSSAGSSRYVRNNAWLVRPNYLARLYLYPLGLARPRIPGLNRTNVYGLLRSHLLQRGARTTLASHAEALQFGKDGERLRLFYLGAVGRQLTVKSLPLDSEAAEAARREVDLRKRLQELRSVALPRIESATAEGSRLFVAEELILGRRFSVHLDARVFRRQLVPQLIATYRALGVESRPLDEFLSSGLGDQVAAILASLPGGREFCAHLTATIASNPPVAVGLCHGDLLPSNLAVADGRVYLLDWGQAKTMPLAFDLLRLAAKYPRARYLTAAVRRLVETDCPVAGSRFDELLTVFLAERIRRDPSGAARHLACWHRMRH